MNILRQKIRRMILESLSLNEHLTKPDPGNLPLQHVEKINSLIDSGDPAMINQARSFVKSLGGPPYYVDEYINYANVGDMEKLGTQSKDIIDTFYMENPDGILSDDPAVYDRLHNMRAQAMSMARQKSLRDNPNPQPSTVKNPGDMEYYADSRYYQGVRANADRYFDILDTANRPRRPLSEHRVAPVPTNIPPHHLNKIHDLIDSGRIEQAQSLIDAFGGPADYVDNYILYGEVGDMEKLGNQAADIYRSGMSDLEKSTALKDIDIQAINISDERGRRLYGSDRSYIDGGGFTTDMDRYIDNRNRKADDALFEHRIAPSLNLPGVPQSHIDKIHSLISAGELEQAQSFIDAFGGPPNYARDYAAYEDVGDLEKLGNKAADIMSRVPKTERGWSTMSDMQPVYDVDKQAYDSVRRKIDRGELDSDLTWDRDYMRDRYFNIRNRDLEHTFVEHRGDKSPTYFDDDGNPLNEHNSSRLGLRRMILQEMSNMGMGGQPPMSIDAMMQELQNIEDQLEEMEMQREEWIANEARYGGDEVEAAYAYEMEFPDYYDEKEELQSRAYELEEMIEAAGGPTL